MVSNSTRADFKAGSPRWLGLGATGVAPRQYPFPGALLISGDRRRFPPTAGHTASSRKVGSTRRHTPAIRSINRRRVSLSLTRSRCPGHQKDNSAIDSLWTFIRQPRQPRRWIGSWCLPGARRRRHTPRRTAIAQQPPAEVIPPGCSMLWRLADESADSPLGRQTARRLRLQLQTGSMYRDAIPSLRYQPG